MLQSTLIGNIGQDAQQKSTNGGNPYLLFSVAVNRKRGDQQETYWVSVFTRQIALLPYLLKGTKVYVSGDLNTKVYQQQSTGQWQAGLNINAKTIQLLGGPRQDGQQQAPSTLPPPVPTPQASDAPPPVDQEAPF